MASRTQIVCLCEGEKGRSIDEVFIYALFSSLKPTWIRQWKNSIVRCEPCGGRSAVIERTPVELKHCLNAGGDTTLVVCADCDDNCADGDALMNEFWNEAQRQGITKEQFDRVVFILAKDRLENWIEFLLAGKTDESKEGQRVKHGRPAADAAKKLADLCKAGRPLQDIPPSLKWSCTNWKALCERMK